MISSPPPLDELVAAQPASVTRPVGRGEVTYLDHGFMVRTYAMEVRLHAVRGQVTRVSWPTEKTKAV